MVKIKRMRIKASELEIGDIVITEDKTNAYIIQRIIKTILHRHRVGYDVKFIGKKKNGILEYEPINRIYLDSEMGWSEEHSSFDTKDEKKEIIRILK